MKLGPRHGARGRLAGILTLAALGALAVSPAPSMAKAPRDLYGVAPQFLPRASEVKRMGQGKVGTLRVQVSWAAAEPEPPDELGPTYSFAQIDPVVMSAAREGIEVLPFIYSTPAWVANDLDSQDCPFYQCYFYPPRSTEALAAWEGFLGALVERYGPGGEFWAENPGIPQVPIRAWQIWNEQNAVTFNRPAPDPGAYAELLRSSASAIRSRDPGGEVILGGMFGTPGSIAAWDYLDQLYAVPGSRDNFDGVAAHPYSSTLKGVKKQINRVRGAIERAADGEVGLWVTEIGWASGGQPDPLNKGRRGQANQLRQAFAYLTGKRRQLNLRNVTWYSWRDNTSGSAGTCSWCPYSGLFEEDRLKAKPAWRAFTEFTGGS